MRQCRKRDHRCAEPSDRIYNEIYRAATLASGFNLPVRRGGTEGVKPPGARASRSHEKRSGIMREGPARGPHRVSAIVGDALRRIMPPDDTVNLSVGWSRAASMRRSIIPKLHDIPRGRERGRYRAPVLRIRKSGSDHFERAHAREKLAPARNSQALPPLRTFDSVLRAATGSTYPAILRVPPRDFGSTRAVLPSSMASTPDTRYPDDDNRANYARLARDRTRYSDAAASLRVMFSYDRALAFHSERDIIAI